MRLATISSRRRLTLEWRVLPPSILGPGLPPTESVVRVRGTRILAGLALLVGVGYLIWRAGFTLNLQAWWLSVPLLVLEIHAFVGLGLFAFSLWDVDSLPAPSPVSETDDRLAVLITTINESEEVLIPAIAAAVGMHLRHETWVLDDGNRPAIRALSESLGAGYLCREAPVAAKAGNLNHALDVIRADFVATFNADIAPSPEFFTRTLGYFEDPTVAGVQTPQDFYKTTSFEHLEPDGKPPWNRQANHEEALFNRVIEPGKNRWNAAFWCGTNAVLRVAALEDIGGIPTDTVTEDLHASVLLQRRGWRLLYHNEVLAWGLAADTLYQFRLQRYRWATGAMQLLRIDNPMFGKALTRGQRIGYAATLLAWFDTWRTLGFMLVPPVVLLTGASPLHVSLGAFALAFVSAYVLR